MTDPARTEGAGRILATAREEAERHGHVQIGTEHLLLALLREREALAPEAAALLPKDAENAAKRLMSAGKRGEAPEGGPALSSRARRIVDEAAAEAGRQGSAALTPDHLLTALRGETKGIAAALLREASGLKKGARPEGAAPAAADPAPAPPPRERTREPKPPAPQPRQEPQGGRSERPGRDKDRRGNAPGDAPRDRRDRRERGERGDRSIPGREARTVPVPPPAEEPEEELPPRRVAPVVGDPFRLKARHLLLPAVPAAIWLANQHASPLLVFAISCVAILPLAQFLGEATEHLAERTGPTIGGFLNATFGNAAELIIAIAALRSGMVELVKASIIGSILGNLLLILGLSLVAAGLKRPVFTFSRTNAGMAAAMLALAVAALVFPALLHATHPEARLDELHLSEAAAIVLAAVYFLSLVFSLHTHKRLLGGDPHPTVHPVWGVPRAVLVLAVATVGIAVISEVLVHAIEPLTTGGVFTQAFLGLILIPIIGNAAEHASAVVMAGKGKVDLALQIALGSSAQVALLVAPVLVGAGLLLGQEMNLVFTPIQVVALALSTGVTALITLDGESHWFEGVQLLALYALVAAAAYFI